MNRTPLGGAGRRCLCQQKSRTQLRRPRWYARSMAQTAAWQGSFSQLLVDEYQDTNRAVRTCHLLSRAHRNLWVVGDDDQAIYTWRGADIRNILDFERSSRAGGWWQLEQNYRSSSPHPRRRQRRDRATTPGRIEKQPGASSARRAGPVVEAEDEHVGRGSSPAASARCSRSGRAPTRSRSSTDQRPVARARGAALRQGVPYQIIGGPRFYERAEVKDAMAYLSVLDNPADEIALRRDHQPAAARHRRRPSVERLPRTARPSGRHAAGRRSTSSRAARAAASSRARRCARSAALMDELREPWRRGAGAATCPRLGSRTDIIEGLEAERRSRPRAHREPARAPSRDAREHGSRTEEPALISFLQEVALPAQVDAVEQDRTQRVTLTTLHGGKGLEFEAVFVIGMEQNLFPHVRGRSRRRTSRRSAASATSRSPARARSWSLVYARQRTLFGARGNNLPVAVHRRDPAGAWSSTSAEPRSTYGSASGRGGSTYSGTSYGDRSGGFQGSSAGATTQLAGIAPRDEASADLGRRQRRPRPAGRRRRHGHGRGRPR